MLGDLDRFHGNLEELDQWEEATQNDMADLKVKAVAPDSNLEEVKVNCAVSSRRYFFINF